MRSVCKNTPLLAHAELTVILSKAKNLRSLLAARIAWILHFVQDDRIS
jgi:hypothetical protein